MRGLGRHYELDVRARGPLDATTGYLVNIKEIDAAVRGGAVPIIERACRERPWSDPGELMAAIVGAVEARLARGGVEVVLVRWRLATYYSVEMATSAMDRVVVRQRFDFAASHRLHVPGLSEARNRELFGKCNHPGGHGHNYRFEPAVEVPLGSAFSLQDLEGLVQAQIIDRYDHKNLSVDCPEFSPGAAGANATVEQIARVFFERLAPAVQAASGGAARLREVTVWETDRTSATWGM
jgi:6-pyruvoyltetrahydropterin/6-carboxytetrahydropterin synthase